MSTTLGSLYDGLLFFLFVTPLSLVFVGVAVLWHGRDRGPRPGQFVPPSHPAWGNPGVQNPPLRREK